jgi:hypothetical protein
MDVRDKLFAEAGLMELKMILGWEFDFRCLKVALPKNKFIAWITDVSQLLDNGTTMAKALESTIGHLGHLALVVQGVHHFLSLLRELQGMATHLRLIQINEPCQADLKLMLQFLDMIPARLALVAIRTKA